MGTVGLRECHLVGEERTTKSEEAKCVKAILHDAIQKAAGQREAVKKKHLKEKGSSLMEAIPLSFKSQQHGLENKGRSWNAGFKPQSSGSQTLQSK